MTARKAEIVAVAGRLFADRGYEGASLRHIGEAVGMRRGSLYAHFDSKEEIVGLLVRPALAQLREVLSAPPQAGQTALEVLRQRMATGIRCCLANRDAILVLFQDHRLLAESVQLRPLLSEAEAITPLWLALIDAARDEGALRSDLESTTVAFGLYALLVATISQRHLGLEQVAGHSLEPERLVEASVTLLLDGVVA